jgi:hypothetical protein
MVLWYFLVLNPFFTVILTLFGVSENEDLDSFPSSEQAEMHHGHELYSIILRVIKLTLREVIILTHDDDSKEKKKTRISLRQLLFTGQGYVELQQVTRAYF